MDPEKIRDFESGTGRNTYFPRFGEHRDSVTLAVDTRADRAESAP